jgi:hypothetical protein
LTFLFAGNTRGTRYDSLNGVVLWSAAWEFAAAERPGGWSAEAFIPWAALGLEGPPASAWRANFIRRDEATLEIAEWAATFSRGGDERKRDGTIAFELLASGG